MTVRTTIALAATAVLLIASPVLAQTEPTTLKDGWYTVETAPAVAPKPSCPTKKPNKKDEFRPMYRARGGVYVECAWDNQGRKPKAVIAYYGWDHGSCLLASQRGVSYDLCMAGGMSVSRTRFFSGGYQPTYEGFSSYNGSYYSSGNGYYSAPPCRDTRDPGCYTMPPSATRVYPPSRPYRTPPPAPPPAQPTGPAKKSIYSCNGNGTDTCYNPPGTGN